MKKCQSCCRLKDADIPEETGFFKLVKHSPCSHSLSFIKVPDKEDCNTNVPVVTGLQKDERPPAGSCTKAPAQDSWSLECFVGPPDPRAGAETTEHAGIHLVLWCKVIFGWICCYTFLKTFRKPSAVYVCARLIIDSRRDSDLLPSILALHRNPCLQRLVSF